MMTRDHNSLRQRIVEGFFRHGVALVNVKEPFRLASGKLSPVYLDHRRAFSIPGLREDLAELWAYEVARSFPHERGPLSNAVVAGTATAGIAPAYALASRLGATFVYVRSKAKEHGLGRMIEGAWNAGSPFLLVDDMVTTGGSVLEAVERVRGEGGSVVLATSVTRHPFSRTTAAFESARVPLVSCFTSPELFSIAADIGLLGANELSAVLEWLSKQE